jgi:hypothetical protein
LDELPGDFPSDVPVYEDATIISTVAGAGAQEGIHNVSMKSADSLADVVAWYKSEIPSKGWTVEADANYGGYQVLTATKEARSLTVSITGADGDVVISLAVTEQK